MEDHFVEEIGHLEDFEKESLKGFEMGKDSFDNSCLCLFE